MKKHINRKIALCMAFMLATGAAFATEALPKKRTWYETSENLLIVQLPAANSEGYEWDYEISDPEMLEMLSIEYTQPEAPDDEMIPEAEETESESVESATEAPAEDALTERIEDWKNPGEVYVASFQTVEGQTGEVTLTLTYSGETEGEEPLRTCTLLLNVGEDGIEVLSADRSSEEQIEEPEPEESTVGE